MTQRKIQYWVIPPEADAEFIAAMEDVLDTYEQPYDADCPVLCMDEQPVQLHKEVRKPIAATKRHARQLIRRIEFRYTPKHGSWLNMAENELSSMTWQCVNGRRFGTKAWYSASNKKQRGVDWRFDIKNARAKLKSLYPKIK